MREDTSSIGSPEVHVPESDRGPAEACVERLARIGFAAEARLEVEVLPHRVDGGPERGRRELDDRVPNGVLDFSVLDEVRLAARILRVVALVVDVPLQDRKSTRLNSSHSQISYAVFCLKKKKDNAQQANSHPTNRGPKDANSPYPNTSTAPHNLSRAPCSASPPPPPRALAAPVP